MQQQLQKWGILQEKLTKLWNMHKSNVLREEINQTVYQTVLIMK